MRSAPIHLLLGHFLASKLSSSWLVGKFWMFTFQPKWKFPIWCQFSPPKVHSPKTASCVSKKGIVRSFFACFLTFWGPKPWWNALEVAEQVYFIMKNLKMQNFRDFDLPIFRVARGALHIEAKNLFFDKIDKIFPKFLEIWTEGSSSRAMMSQGCLSQYLESFIHFLPPWSSLYLCFQTPDSRFVH